MKIANKISLSFLITAVILTFVGVSSFYIVGKSALLSLIFAHLRTTAQLRASQIEAFIEEHKGHIKMLSEMKSAQSTLNSERIKGKSSEILEGLKKHAKTKYINELFIMNREGIVVASLNKEDIGKNRSSYIDISKAKENVHIQDVRISNTGKGVINISAAVKDDGTGRFLGILSAEINLDMLDKITSDRTGLGETGEIYLVNKDGYMITPSRFRENTFLKQKVDTWNVKKALADKERNLTDEGKAAIFPGYRGVRVLGTHQYIPQMDWVLLTEVDESEAFVPLNRLKMIFVILMFSIPLAAWLTGIFVSKIITKPIHKLHKGTETIGTGNLDYKVGTDAKDEIGQLSRAFDAMTGKLKDTTTSIDSLNKEIDERKRAEELLIESEGKFRAIFDSATDGILLANLENKTFHTGNKMICQMLGYSHEELKNSGVIGIHPEESLPYVMEQFEKQSKGEIQLAKDIPVKRKDGSIFYADISSSLIILNRKKYLMGIFRDMTESKKAEKEIKRQKDFIEKVINALNYPFYVINPDYTIALTNKIAREKGVVKGRRCYELTHNRQSPCEKEHACPLQEVFRTKKSVRMEHIYHDREGKKMIVEIHGNPIFDADGNVVQIIEYTIDITERIQMEKKLIESEEKYRRQFNEALDGIILTDASTGIIIDCNQAAAELTGRDKSELIGKYQKVLHPTEEHGETFSKTFKKHLEDKEGESLDAKIITKEGKIKDVSIKTNLLEIEGKKILQGIFRDITERKKSEQALHEAYEKLKETQEQLIQSGKMAAMGQLAAGVSHELNQPLTGIKGFAQATLMDMDEKNPVRADLNKIIEQADRMDKIIQHVRFFARRSEFAMKEIDINQPIEDSLMLLDEQLRVHNVRVKKSLSENLPEIQGDPNQLEQVFLNLITNARDSVDSLRNPEGGELIVKTFLSRDKKKIEIIFEDTGCGIPKENLEHIFNPFFTTKSPEGGIGLGLSILYRIIENHKGSIEVESKEGKGTMFRIVLPIANTDDRR